MEIDGTLTWQDVFDSSKTWHSTLNNAMIVAKKVGYQFFVFNERIYYIDKNTYKNTELFIKDLQ